MPAWIVPPALTPHITHGPDHDAYAVAIRTAQATAARRRITFPLRSHLSLLRKVGEYLSNAVVTVRQLENFSRRAGYFFSFQFCDFFSLSAIYCRRYELSGPIPSELGQLSNLKVLDLCRNEFEGPIPVELGRLSNLRQLFLANNQLAGSIPKELGQLVKLTRLNLSDNSLTGSIPFELGQLSNLIHLWLGSNQLAGAHQFKYSQLPYCTVCV